MTCHVVTMSTTVTSATEVQCERHRLGAAHARVWHDLGRDRWESATEVEFATRAEAVAATVADLRRRAADMLALADAMEAAP